jgi:hypothetical protein
MRVTMVLCLLVSVTFLACERKESAAAAAAVEGRACEPGVSDASCAPAATAAVARVVFIDKENACQCTQKRVDAAWTVLQGALAGRKDVSVERIHIDTEMMRVAPYRQMRPMMVLPAMYFLDGSGVLVEMLQGEVTPGQVVAVLATKGAAR